MLACACVSVLLGEPEINDVNLAPLGPLVTDCEVLRLHIPVDVAVRMHELNPPDLTESSHQKLAICSAT